MNSKRNKLWSAQNQVDFIMRCCGGRAIDDYVIIRVGIDDISVADYDDGGDGGGCDGDGGHDDDNDDADDDGNDDNDDNDDDDNAGDAVVMLRCSWS